MGRLYLIVVAFLGMFGCVASNFTPSASRLPRRSTADLSPRIVTVEGRGPTIDRSGNADEIVLDRHNDGHFYADVEVNGTLVHMLVDTGASGIALSREDARSAGIATSIGMNDIVGEGADGAVRGEVIRIDRLRLGETSAEGLDAVVLNSGGMSLLGQDFLRQFQSVKIEDDRMILR